MGIKIVCKHWLMGQEVQLKLYKHGARSGMKGYRKRQRHAGRVSVREGVRPTDTPHNGMATEAPPPTVCVYVEDGVTMKQKRRLKNMHVFRGSGM